MSFRAIARTEVPALKIVQDRLGAMFPLVQVDDTARNSETEAYCIRLAGPTGRQADLEVSRELLDDLRDNKQGPESKYTAELLAKIDAKIHNAVTGSRLSPYKDEDLKFLLLKFVAQQSKNGNSVHKYNTIGRGRQGDFEHWLGAELSQDEKEILIWAWGELARTRMITPTGTDLVEPDNWVKATGRGTSAVEAGSLTESPETERRKAPHFQATHGPNISDRTRAADNEVANIDLDALLAISSRKEYEKKLPTFAELASEDSPLSLIMVDLDHFKRVNDTFGHDVGDKVLIQAGNTIRGAVGAKGEVFRYGGEEIVVLLPNHDPAEAGSVANRIRRSIERMNIPEVKDGVTASLGVSTMPHTAQNDKQLFKQADEALYTSKNGGRNQVTLASGPEGPQEAKRKPARNVDPFQEHKIAEAKSLLAPLTYADRDLIRFVLIRGSCSNHVAAKAAHVPNDVIMRAFTLLPQQGIIEWSEDTNRSLATISINEHWIDAFKQLLFPREEGENPVAFGH
jgi:diguanylate cyclase (GGDEF)-like protein